MKSWLSKLLSKFLPSPVIILSERKKINPASEAAIVLLAEHSGFIALMDRFEIQKALLEADLRTKRHASIREVDALQAGIQWISYLQEEVERRVYKRTNKLHLRAELAEADELAIVRRSVERIVPQGQ